MTKRTNEALTAFQKTDEEARRAYLQKDVDLDDILSIELTERQRQDYVRLLRQWGRTQEWYSR